MASETSHSEGPSSGNAHQPPAERAAWRDRMYEIIFEADTFGGQLFDIVLLIAILISIITISLETVSGFREWQPQLNAIEWGLTILFTAEYVARLICVGKPLRYACSFFGIIDLLACLPMYLSLSPISLQSQSMMIFRSVRLLRVFRVLKMMRMLKEAHSLQNAVWRSRDKIFVFIAVVLVAVTISGTLMYQIENADVDNADSKFTSIPMAMYWAVVTMTTVGYGDITPETVPGKIISAALILLGYSLIIVPTGFVSAEISSLSRHRDLTARACPHCLREGHSPDAAFCDMCGDKLLAPRDTADSSPGG